MESIEGVIVFKYPNATTLQTSPEHAASLVAAGTHRMHGFTLRNYFVPGTNYISAKTVQWEGEREQSWPVREFVPDHPAPIRSIYGTFPDIGARRLAI